VQKQQRCFEKYVVYHFKKNNSCTLDELFDILNSIAVIRSWMYFVCCIYHTPDHQHQHFVMVPTCSHLGVTLGHDVEGLMPPLIPLYPWPMCPGIHRKKYAVRWAQGITVETGICAISINLPFLHRCINSCACFSHLAFSGSEYTTSALFYVRMWIY